MAAYRSGRSGACSAAGHDCTCRIECTSVMSGLGAPAALPGVDAGRCGRRTGRGSGRCRRDSRATIWATRAGWRGAVRLGAGRFGLRRPSSVRLASLAQRSCGATTSGEWRRARRRSGLADEEKNFSFRGCIRRPMGHTPGPTTCTAVRGAPPLHEKVVSSQRTTKAKARRSHSLPLLTYSRLGGLRQDPGRAAESAVGPRTDEDMGARRACVVVDLWGTR
jgi:hypothetical protein